MKKLILVAMVLLLSAGPVFAAGGKNRSEKGKGSTHTGEQAQGQASQKRAGR